MTDDESFEAFVRRYQDMVFASAVRLLGDRAEAEDVAQTVFLRAFRRFENVVHNPAAAGWLKTVTTNLCLNHLSRHRSRWRLFSELTRPSPGANDSDAGVESAFEATLASDSSPALDLEQADERESLERALQELPAHQRVPLVLFHFDGRTYQEIADRLRVSVGKIKTDIHRGRETLRQRLTDAHARR